MPRVLAAAAVSLVFGNPRDPGRYGRVIVVKQIAQTR
jgi:hypothetical protein